MSHARVQSIQAIAEFQDHLQHFRRSLIKELETLQGELSKVAFWILEEADAYWSEQRKIAHKTLNEYQQQLSRCLSYVREDERRSCTEEKKRVSRARQRLELCDEKLRMAKTAARHWESRQQKMRTRIEHCRDLVDSDLAVANTRVLRYLETLESYANLGRQTTASAESSLPKSEEVEQEEQEEQE